MARQSQQIAPDNLSPYVDGANYLLALQHFDQVRPLVQEAAARKLNNLIGHAALYGMAFLGVGLHRPWLSSSSGSRRFQRWRTSGFRWTLTRRLTAAIWGKRGS